MKYGTCYRKQNNVCNLYDKNKIITKLRSLVCAGSAASNFSGPGTSANKQTLVGGDLHRCTAA